ncbi:YggT family protein [Candidatus Methylomirabilis sp.]|uniref:YggT family protein n=1 Tax=Candidatus Methylomirabilis sp. TaxID=2032687 RepID=UPI0030768524
MPFVANFIAAFASILSTVLTIYTWMFIIRALLSWVNPDPWNPIVQFLARATDPVLRPIQQLIPMWRLGIDISPIIAILALQFVQRWFIPSLQEIAWNLSQ